MSYVPQFIEPEQEDDESDFEEADDDEDDVTVNDVCRNGQKTRLTDWGFYTGASLYNWVDRETGVGYFVVSNEGQNNLKVRIRFTLFNLEIEDNDGSTLVEYDLEPDQDEMFKMTKPDPDDKGLLRYVYDVSYL